MKVTMRIRDFIAIMLIGVGASGIAFGTVLRSEEKRNKEGK